MNIYRYNLLAYKIEYYFIMWSAGCLALSFITVLLSSLCATGELEANQLYYLDSFAIGFRLESSNENHWQDTVRGKKRMNHYFFVSGNSTVNGQQVRTPTVLLGQDGCSSSSNSCAPTFSAAHSLGFCL